jgi:tRNA threonylcarbamoyl adenosine modification protein (Sua5/YciO/YrdC/YwlC family)
MAQYFVIHEQNPQIRLIHQAVEILRNGGVIAYPTDSGYALGCVIGNKEAQTRIRQIRGVDEDHHFTLVCRNLAELATYAQVNNSQFRLLKANTPGQYTFILKATREVPKRLQHPKKSTLGLRVPDHVVTQSLLEALGEPLLSMTLSIKDQSGNLTEAWQIRDVLEHQLDLVIDAGACLSTPTTVIDLTGDEPQLIRAGAGALSPFGLTENE